MPTLILPPEPVSSEVLARVCSITGVSNVMIRHRSGLPWVISDSGSEDTWVLRLRGLDVVSVGLEAWKCERLERAGRSIRSISDMNALLSSAVGGNAIAAVVSGREMRAYCPVFLTRSLFWTRYDGLTVLCDEQMPLAALNNYEIDTDVLVARLANLETSHPFSKFSIWRGVEGLAVGQYLVVDQGSRLRRATWWSPPTQTESLSALAPAVASGIQVALEERLKQHRIISTDLSGGLDSTTLSFYVSGRECEHHTIFLKSDETTNNDWQWASRAAQEMKSNHHIFSYSSILEELETVEEVSLAVHPEGPGVAATLSSSVPILERILSVTGSTLHMNGHAGDALFGELATTLWSMARTSWSGKYRWIWSYALLNRTPVRELIRMLRYRASYRSELIHLASGRYSPGAGISNNSRWIQTPTFPRALTPDAQRAVARLAERELLQDGDALANSRMANEIISYLAVHGAAQRQMNLAATRMRFDSPYLDTRIVEPAMALDITERAAASHAKPLLAAARPLAMDIEYFLRRDKADYSADEYVGRERRLARVKELFASNSLLEELGLVARGEVVRLAQAYSPDGSAYSSTASLEFAERWLRAVKQLRGDARSKVR